MAPPFTESVQDKPFVENAQGKPAAPLLLRTHTSPMQVRTMEKKAAACAHHRPLEKSIAATIPTRTHGFMFHQIEGLAVDTDITFLRFSRARSNISCANFLDRK